MTIGSRSVRIDLSCDLGEAVSAQEDQVEAAIWPLITSANVACGGHVGDADTMRMAVNRAREFSVVLGAHPSYPDRVNFGRKSLSISSATLQDTLIEQIEGLRSIALEAGVPLRHVKAHGALYNDAHHDSRLAEVIVEAMARVGGSLAVVASRQSRLFAAAGEAGLPIVTEAFADRRYRDDGSLVPRSEGDEALLLDPSEAAEQALLMARKQQVVAQGGAVIEISFKTLCVHSDMPGSVARLQRIYARLQQEGFDFSSEARL